MMEKALGREARGTPRKEPGRGKEEERNTEAASRRVTLVPGLTRTRDGTHGLPAR